MKAAGSDSGTHFFDKCSGAFRRGTGQLQNELFAADTKYVVGLAHVLEHHLSDNLVDIFSISLISVAADHLRPGFGADACLEARRHRARQYSDGQWPYAVTPRLLTTQVHALQDQ